MTKDNETQKLLSDICSAYEKAPEATVKMLQDTLGKTTSSKVTLHCTVEKFAEVGKQYGAHVDWFKQFASKEILAIMGDTSVSIEVKQKAANAFVCLGQALMPHTPPLDATCHADMNSTFNLVKQRNMSRSPTQ